MNKIDKDGLTLCSLQGNIFAESLDAINCSSEVFMRRFMFSTVAKEFDSKAILDDSLTISEVFYRIEEEFGKTDYGKTKYNKEVLFWIGYIYRYFSYTYDLSSKYIYKIIKPKELNKLYYVYHTFDPSNAIERILEEKNISFDNDKQNERLLEMLRKKHYDKEISLEKMSLSNSRKKEKNNYVLYAIMFQDEVIGEIRFNKHDKETYELEIVLKDDRYKNKGIDTVAIEKVIPIAKNKHNIKNIIVKILKTNEKNIHCFKNLDFKYSNENDDYAYFTKAV